MGNVSCEWKGPGGDVGENPFGAYSTEDFAYEMRREKKITK
jgi:hypothetical protein